MCASYIYRGLFKAKSSTVTNLEQKNVYHVKSYFDTSLWSHSFYYVKAELLTSKPQVYVCDKHLFV